MSKGGKPERISMSFFEAFERVRRERFGSGRDKKPLSSIRFTEAIAKHQLFPSIEEDLKKWPSKR